MKESGGQINFLARGRALWLPLEEKGLCAVPLLETKVVPKGAL